MSPDGPPPLRAAESAVRRTADADVMTMAGRYRRELTFVHECVHADCPRPPRSEPEPVTCTASRCCAPPGSCA